MRFAHLENLAQNVTGDKITAFKDGFGHVHRSYEHFRPDSYDNDSQVEDLYSHLDEYITYCAAKIKPATLRNYLGYMLKAWDSIHEFRALFSQADQKRIGSYMRASKTKFNAEANAVSKANRAAKAVKPPTADDADSVADDEESNVTPSVASHDDDLRDSIISIEVSLKALQHQNETLTKRCEVLAAERQQAVAERDHTLQLLTALREKIAHVVNVYVKEDSECHLILHLLDSKHPPSLGR
jgi:hypothetical protein